MLRYTHIEEDITVPLEGFSLFFDPMTQAFGNSVPSGGNTAGDPDEDDEIEDEIIWDVVGGTVYTPRPDPEETDDPDGGSDGGDGDADPNAADTDASMPQGHLMPTAIPAGVHGAQGLVDWQVGGMEPVAPSAPPTGGLTDPSAGPAAGDDPEEVNGVSGTSGDDLLVLNYAAWAEDGATFVEGLDGDDMIVRDRAGHYATAQSIKIYGDDFFGNDGVDTVNYTLLSTGITADLGHNPGYGLVVQDLPPWAQGSDTDKLYHVENIVGTYHDDDIAGDAMSNELHGHGGDDTLLGRNGNDLIFGGGDNDDIHGGGHDDELHGGQGFDDIDGGTGADTLHGEDGNDMLQGGSGTDMVYGGDGDDTLYGGMGTFDDVLDGGDGDDDMFGGWGNDAFYTGDGADFVKGGKGDDVVYVSGFGDNILAGNVGYDTLVFNNSSVDVSLTTGTAYRSDGTDSLSSFENVIAGNGSDIVQGSNGANQIFTDGGKDVLIGEGGYDFLSAGSGDDTVEGGDGNDDIFGADGDDELSGDNGNDTIAGGQGSDWIRGGQGSDHIYTGNGPDTVHWEQGDTGLDDLFDFNLAEDKLSFGPDFFHVAWYEQWQTFNLSDKLDAVDGGTYSLVRAMVNDGSDTGTWQWIARLHDTDHSQVNQMIANGTLLDIDVAVIGDGAPDGLDFGV